MAPYACATVMAAKRMPVVIRYGFIKDRWVICAWLPPNARASPAGDESGCPQLYAPYSANDNQPAIGRFPRSARQVQALVRRHLCETLTLGASAGNRKPGRSLGWAFNWPQAMYV